MYFFAGFFFESHLVYDQTQGSGAVFLLLCVFVTLRITLIYSFISPGFKRKNELDINLHSLINSLTSNDRSI